MKIKLCTAAALVAYAAMGVLPALADQYSWSPQLAQVGVTKAIQYNAGYGQGVTIGIVDTGIVASNPEVIGRVLSSSSCAAVTFSCAHGVTDDNSHGTAVAAIAAGGLNTGGLMVGVAPGASILSMKVLNAQGSGYDVDVANGIVAAANGGAKVINLSLTYIPTAAVINALNYAAAKGATIVFAGGNSATSLNGGNSTFGLTAAALKHLVFVGSVNSANNVSSFSNRPGNGAAYATTGGSASYASLWLMAPGENIVAPYITNGNGSYAYWTGTSMAAPIVTGAIALLENRWPVLYRNGTATQLLFATTQDLGNKGLDTTYGNGLLRVDQAFQPVGGLTVTASNGKSLPLSSLTGSVLTSGALGSLSSISSLLSNYTTFDSYQRDFKVNLSGLIASRPTAPILLAQALQPTAFTSTARLTDGSYLAFGSLTETPNGVARPTAHNAFSDSAAATRQNGSTPSSSGWFVSFTDAGGSTIAAGHGFPVSMSFAGALYGVESNMAQQTAGLGVSNALMSLAEGGDFAAWGTQLSKESRVAFSYSETQKTDGVTDSGWARPSARAVGAGLSGKLAQGLTGGVTVGMLNEQHGLLGSTYSGPLGLGNNHKSVSLGASTGIALAEGLDLLVEASWARSDGASLGGGLLSNLSDVDSRSYGATLSQRSLFDDGDRVTASFKKPLKVISGSVGVQTVSVDSDGWAHTSLSHASLRPNGSESDISLGYQAPLRENTSWTAAIDGRSDADNIKGESEAVFRIGVKTTF